ncbi:ThiF family adenylyltransferase [Gelidibacter salicanalis]|uniref:Molybdopterin-synthase adenylyltransferase n=1 Tax=Gelidibacter salicanalis TaxID=291193 RepID=A0A934NID3_9FLAO|nr:ThiF family adenylyltransferase [Gelidibacter salicanalis]MBJ7881971.1 ThiF family adenylyltransferase [Gelidibacter salicanalis]
MNLSAEEQEQYSRHLRLDEVGIAGQLKLKQAKVLVIGAGGLSCPVLQYLSAAGVGTIGIVDDDIIEHSNLQRQILYTHKDLGRYKVKSAVERLQMLNPYIQYNAYQTRLTKDNALELFADYDIIVDGTDNFPTRYLINDAAVLLGKPVVFGSIHKFEGQVSVFNFRNGATYRCLYPTPPKDNEVPNCSEIGVLGVLPGIIGSLQANEVLKIILGLGKILSGQLLTFDALSLKQTLFSVEKNISINITTLEDDYQAFCGIPKDIEEISYQKYEEHISSFNLLDVRTQTERDAYYINSIHIPLDELSERCHEIPDNKNLLVCCQSGIRSKLAIGILKEKRFGRALVNLKDGLKSRSS